MEQRLLVGFLVVIATGVSFALTIFFLGGFLLAAGLLLGATGVGFLFSPASRGSGRWLLAMAGVMISGPLIYLALALAQQ